MNQFHDVPPIPHLNKKQRKSINLRPTHILEGLFAQTLANVSGFLDIFYASIESPEESIVNRSRFQNKATLMPQGMLVKVTFMNIISTLEEMIKNAHMYSDASLNVRHRKTRKLINDFLVHCSLVYETFIINSLKAEANDIITDTRLISFFKDLACFMLSYHHLLSANSSIKDRANIELEITEQFSKSKDYVSAQHIE